MSKKNVPVVIVDTNAHAKLNGKLKGCDADLGIILGQVCK